MLTLTQTDAIAFARFVYQSVAQRAVEATQGDERDYVLSLARSWDERLLLLARALPLAPVSSESRTILDRLTAAASHPGLSATALVEWVDALPSAVEELFVPSASDETEEPTNEAELADYRQPALALAA